MSSKGRLQVKATTPMYLIGKEPDLSETADQKKTVLTFEPSNPPALLAKD